MPDQDHRCHVGQARVTVSRRTSGCGPRDRRQRGVPQGRTRTRWLRRPRLRRPSSCGRRRARLRLGRADGAHGGRARRRGRCVRPAPVRRRGRAQRTPAAQARALRRQPVPDLAHPLVRRRGRRRRDRRDQHVRRRQVRRDGAARRGLGAAHPADRPGGRHQGARARPVGGRVRRVRPRRRRLRGGRGVAGGGRRRGGVLGVLTGPHQRLRPHLHPQARDRRDAPGRGPAEGADAPVRRGRGQGHRPRGEAVLRAMSTTTWPARPRPSTGSTTC